MLGKSQLHDLYYWMQLTRILEEIRTPTSERRQFGEKRRPRLSEDDRIHERVAAPGALHDLRRRSSAVTIHAV